MRTKSETVVSTSLLKPASSASWILARQTVFLSDRVQDEEATVFTVEVLNPDDSPAQGITVVVDPGQVMGLTAPNGMARLTINTDTQTTKLTVTAKTRDPRITIPERQASASMDAVPYESRNKNYIHIGVDAAELNLGENLRINLNLKQQSQNNDITYLILSRGQLVKYNRYRMRQGQVLISLSVLITKEMLDLQTKQSCEVHTTKMRLDGSSFN
ncbi:complement C3-like [Morone saxatilis]|uniref:complement C3-like n=1 Tax=Morone saxatilis TaxID=34816 RepID=UPI0015E1EB94|nr:complement C3-like [Morone saxatilis]